MPSDTMHDSINRPLEADETLSLISSEKVDGTAVYNRNGDRLGTVHHLMIDKFSGNVEYAVMSFGGFLGIGESYHPLPWSAPTIRKWAATSSISTAPAWNGRRATRRAACRTGTTALIARGSTNTGSRRSDLDRHSLESDGGRLRVHARRLLPDDRRQPL